MELWTEYRQLNKDGYEYSWFCEEYGRWLSKVEPIMRQVHKFGEKCFVDYSGDTVPIVDPTTGVVTQAQIFVGAMGASNYTYVTATLTQTLPDWIKAHVDMLRHFGACPKVLVPDNLPAGVKKAEFYEPSINPTYNEMAKHYGLVVLPARKRKPTDKAKVEGAVLIVEREILARLRKHTFYDLASLNEGLAELQDQLNDREFQKLPGSRREAFLRDDVPSMQALPSSHYELGVWRKAKVHIDYHIEVESHYYSVPHELIREAVEVRLTPSVVEVFHSSVRVASHKRSYERGTTTLDEHMPAQHRAVKNWTPTKVAEWGNAIGPATGKAIQCLLDRSDHPEQGVRSCLGLLSLKKSYGAIRLEDACSRALSNVSGRIYSYRTVRNILEKNLDNTAIPRPATVSVGHHENVRGEEYYDCAGVFSC